MGAVKATVQECTTFVFTVNLLAIRPECLPAGIMTDKAVAEADLMTLVPALERFSPSAESCWWRTLRSTRSVVAPRGPCGSGRPRTVALLGRGNIASAGLKCLSAKLNPTVNNSVIEYRFRVTSYIV